MLQVVMLVCSVAVGHADCQPGTALSVTYGPRVSNPFQCGLFGQSSIATTAIAPVAGSEYLKVACLRRPALEASR